jgi:hypothetical protein
LKRQLGYAVMVQDTLHYVDNADERVLLRLKAALKYRITKGVTKVLIYWDGISHVDATWEKLEDMQHRFPFFGLEDKDNPKGKGLLHACG